MHTTSLDILEKTELPTSQARAILHVMDLELAAREEVIATKSDLREAFHALELGMESIRTEIRGFRGGMESVKGELLGEIGSLRGELRGEMGSLRGELRREIESLRGDVQTKIEFVRGEIGAKVESVRGELSTKIASASGELRVEIEAVRGDVKGAESRLMRWVVTCAIGLVGTIASGVYFAIKHLRP